MKRKVLIPVIITLIALMLLPGCAGKKDDGKFRVGLEAAYAPFNWTQLDNSNGAVKIEGTAEYAVGMMWKSQKRLPQVLAKSLSS